MPRQVDQINVGCDAEGWIVLQFELTDATTFAARFSRSVCAKFIALLEEVHGQAMSLPEAVSPPAAWNERLGIQESVQMTLQEGDPDDGKSTEG